MLNRLRHLFWHHHLNNHRPKILHSSSLTVLVLIVLIFQFSLSYLTRIKPGVLGFASSITPAEIINLTNQQRNALGLSTLKANDLLSQVAEAKARFMFANNFWAHNSPDGVTPWYFFKQFGYQYRFAGENLARDFNDANSVVDAWMRSPSHKDNILSGNYNDIGVAVVDGILNGQETTLVVQMFGKPTIAKAAIYNQAGQDSRLLGKNDKSSKLLSPGFIGNLETEENDQAVFGQTENIFVNNSQEYNVSQLPFLSSLDLTKSLNLALAFLIMTVLLIDGWLAWHKQTIRIAGKSFVHFSFLALVILIILATGSGRIL